MSSAVDTTTKLSYLLPTGTFLTFQVLAPLATNNGKCGVTEKILTGATLLFLVMGCIITSFTDSYTAPDGKVYNGFLTKYGLLVPGYEAAEMVGGAEEDGQVLPEKYDETKIESAKPKAKAKEIKRNTKYIVGPTYRPMQTDYINAALSAVSFLTLTMFTDPVSTCFYPHLSETVLKTLPVMLAAVLSFFCSFSAKIRHGYGNSLPRKPDEQYTPLTKRALPGGDHQLGAAFDDTKISVNFDDTKISVKVDGPHDVIKYKAKGDDI